MLGGESCLVEETHSNGIENEEEMVVSEATTTPKASRGKRKAGKTPESNSKERKMSKKNGKMVSSNGLGGGGGRQMALSEMFGRTSQKRKVEDTATIGDSSVNKHMKEEEEEEKEDKEVTVEEKEEETAKAMAEESSTHTSNGVTKQIHPPAIEPPKLCQYCRQHFDDSSLAMFIGDPENALDKFVTLADPSLSLLNMDQESSIDEIPQHKITDFSCRYSPLCAITLYIAYLSLHLLLLSVSVYDKNNHLCSFDIGLIERNVELYFSGAVKPIYDENPDPSDGIPTKQLGPINSWWIAGFDGGEKALIGFTTAYAEYVLMEPSPVYEKIMATVHEKIYLSKVVIEYLEEELAATYEDLNRIQTTVPPETIGCSSFTEDTLLRHAQFVVEQAESYDQYGDPDEDLLLTSLCMRDLISLAGVTLGKRRASRRSARPPKPKKAQHTMATTTPLVHNIFEMFFKDQIDNKPATSAPCKRRCGVCEACQQSDCGKCNACRDMVKFGGSGRSKQACVHRRCPYMVVQDDEDDYNENAELAKLDAIKSPTKKIKSEKKIKT